MATGAPTKRKRTAKRARGGTAAANGVAAVRASPADKVILKGANAAAKAIGTIANRECLAILAALHTQGTLTAERLGVVIGGWATEGKFLGMSFRALMRKLVVARAVVEVGDGYSLTSEGRDFYLASRPWFGAT